MLCTLSICAKRVSAVRQCECVHARVSTAGHVWISIGLFFITKKTSQTKYNLTGSASTGGSCSNCTRVSTPGLARLKKKRSGVLKCDELMFIGLRASCSSFTVVGSRCVVEWERDRERERKQDKTRERQREREREREREAERERKRKEKEKESDRETQREREREKERGREREGERETEREREREREREHEWCLWLATCESRMWWHTYERFLHQPCKTLQHVSSHCNTMQHTATHCNTRGTHMNEPCTSHRLMSIHTRTCEVFANRYPAPWTLS